MSQKTVVKLLEEVAEFIIWPFFVVTNMLIDFVDELRAMLGDEDY